MPNRNPSTKALSALARVPAATVYEANGKCGDMAPAIRPLVPGARLFGPAFTVRCLPGDFAAVLRAIDRASLGDVLVIDGGGTDRVTALGGTSSLAARRRGLAGAVVDGAVRDIDEIRRMRFPVFGLATSVRGTLRGHPGWLQVPVSVGGIVVAPGDLVFGDGDGVVVVARDRTAGLVDAVRRQRANERLRERQVRAGRSFAEIFGLQSLED